MGLAAGRELGDTRRVTSDDPTSDTAKATAENPHVHPCPVCGNPVDPRKTTQALHRQGRLLLFCSSGCLRDFMRKERAGS
jgi:YHS domain-containing protein